MSGGRPVKIYYLTQLTIVITEVETTRVSTVDVTYYVIHVVVLGCGRGFVQCACAADVMRTVRSTTLLHTHTHTHTHTITTSVLKHSTVCHHRTCKKMYEKHSLHNDVTRQVHVKRHWNGRGSAFSHGLFCAGVYCNYAQCRLSPCMRTWSNTPPTHLSPSPSLVSPHLPYLPSLISHPLFCFPLPKAFPFPTPSSMFITCHSLTFKRRSAVTTGHFLGLCRWIVRRWVFLSGRRDIVGLTNILCLECAEIKSLHQP